MAIRQMMRGSVVITRNALPNGYAGVARDNPAAGAFTAEVMLVASPEISRAELQVPVRGGVARADIGGEWTLSPIRWRILGMLPGLLGSVGHNEYLTFSFPLRDEQGGANPKTLTMNCLGETRRRAAIERDLSTPGQIVTAEFETKLWTYEERISGISTALIDYVWDDHLYAGGWNLDTNAAVSGG